MAFPLSLPSVSEIRRISMGPRSLVAILSSPFNFSEQIYVHQGEKWIVEIELVPMNQDSAEPWLAWLLALNGREGTFLCGDPRGAAPRGTWSGSILVKGAAQSGKTLLVDGAAPAATAKAGDYFQLGSGLTSTLHKLTADVVFNGSGEATLTFWPRLRSSPADNAPLTILAAKGLFRLLNNENSWAEEEGLLYGLVFSAEEAVSG